MNSNDNCKVFVVERNFQITGNKTAVDCESMNIDKQGRKCDEVT
jgi:hypothetical protein